MEEHPSQVVYGEGSFNVPGWCDARGNLQPDLSAHPDITIFGTINGVSLYKVPMPTGQTMTNARIEKICGRYGLLTPCYDVGGQTSPAWNDGNCEEIPGHSDHDYLPESIAAQLFGCSSPSGCPQMDA